jgi:thiamine-monophosphate kinase
MRTPNRKTRPTIGEEDVVRQIRRAFSQSATGSLAVGMGDDAAVSKPPPGMETVLTTDWFLEGKHFLRDKHPADAVGWKCLARAVSDIAAMGAKPRCFLLSLALPRELTGQWLEEFLAGLKRASRAFECELAGGDTTQEEEILINVTVMGEVAAGRAVLRSRARPGDLIYVSGVLGAAEFGWRSLRESRGVGRAKGRTLLRHLYPEPRLALGQWLARERLASSMMDLSDGLSTDLGRLCAASGVGAVIRAVDLPGKGTGEARIALALDGGEDYELLFTVAKKNSKFIPGRFRGVPLYLIGEVQKEKKIMLTWENGERRKLQAGGWDPFRE